MVVKGSIYVNRDRLFVFMEDNSVTGGLFVSRKAKKSGVDGGAIM